MAYNYSNINDYDVLVIGGGIAGIEAALNLAYQGYKVILVEKDLSIGGKMIHLSKVFPTLDCAACITTPKVSETARHPNIKIYTYSEIKDIEKLGERYFTATLVQKPRYVTDACTGCQLCEEKCPVVVEDEYQWGLVGRKAAYIPFSIANPRIAAIDIENCTFCGLCEKVCAAGAIDFTQEEKRSTIVVKSIIIATGFNLFQSERLSYYGAGKFKNLLTSMQMERQLVPTRPYNNVLRPKDGKVPDRIAYVLCVGSRDKSLGNPICSQVCCMYSIKQAQLLMGALPMADVTIYYIDIRAFGKGFDEFYKQGVGMGVNFVKGKIANISEKENGDLILRYEDIDSGVLKEATHDLVVLSVGILTNPDFEKLFKTTPLLKDDYGYVRQVSELLSPSKTSIDGVFVAGTASGPMDIPDSILSAGAASTEASVYMKGGAS
ncbi:MAG: CoB--CoM heterodisulfide reductase iron-sulfur subunit A family protein [Bacteroidales bacterium]|nr:CoB--CoM heterodisulfide reductase iron-sulfur subunit A family protein [Bacteroidales bacterium]MBN2698407.1 CoB--CoM heterodisulfide reductase iron-sulfur subunit A family protein [Bacteroidales bacterium]